LYNIDPWGRKFLWVWSKAGNLGKSWLANYLITMGDKVQKIGPNDNARDVWYACNWHKTAVFDVERIKMNSFDYSLIVSCGQSTVSCPKYKSLAVKFKYP